MNNFSKLLGFIFIFAGSNLSNACAQEIVVTQDQLPPLKENLDNLKFKELLDYIRDNNKKNAKKVIDELANNNKLNEPDRLGKTILMYLVIHDRKDLIEYLFDNYADQLDNTKRDNMGQTALDIANAKSGNTGIVEIISGTAFSPKLNKLLNLIRDKKAKKADDFIKKQVTLEELKKAKDKAGRTLLMYAAMYGDKDIMQSLLVKLGSDESDFINKKDKYDNTALMYAALYGNPAIIKLLREQGANPNFKNSHGSTAFKMVIDRIVGNQGATISWPTVTPEFAMTKRAITSSDKYDDYVTAMDELMSFKIVGDDARAIKHILRDYAKYDRNINKKNNSFEIRLSEEK